MTPHETAQHLYEIEQIKQTKARYFRFLDTKQWTDWRTCFTDFHDARYPSHILLPIIPR